MAFEKFTDARTTASVGAALVIQKSYSQLKVPRKWLDECGINGHCDLFFDRKRNAIGVKPGTTLRVNDSMKTRGVISASAFVRTFDLKAFRQAPLVIEDGMLVIEISKAVSK